ncbi:2'-5' RNA ligase family protein [Streptomyces sp. NPDC012950]|uniref:2'-5' RNA ligase family protein n=1 Tax=Streptomyces sp. NPDC012950 TaxID=3364858 RepID=UPI00369F0E89
MGTDGMHRTLLHAIGPSRGDVDTDVLVKDVEARLAAVEPFTPTFDRPAIGPCAIELSGRPGRPFTALVDAVTEATTLTGAAFRPGRSRYPHLSVAYTTAGAEHVDPIALRAASADIDRPLPAAVLADRIHQPRARGRPRRCDRLPRLHGGPGAVAAVLMTPRHVHRTVQPARMTTPSGVRPDVRIGTTRPPSLPP